MQKKRGVFFANVSRFTSALSYTTRLHFSQKKTQVSIYILAGIILLIFAIVFAIFSQQSALDVNDSQNAAQSAIRGGTIEESVQFYVSQCIDTQLQPLLTQMAYGGGTLGLRDASSQYIWYNREEYHALCLVDEKSKDCTPIPLLRQHMEEELALSLVSRITTCVTNTPFEDQGYNIIYEQIAASDITVRIRERTVDVVIRMPTQIRNSDGSGSLQISEYTTISHSSLGLAYELANTIVNSHILVGDFDPTQYMLTMPEKYKIQKHKPYPNTVYKVSVPQKDRPHLDFLFALQLKDTVNLLGQAQSIINPHQCCINPRDNLFFANVLSCDAHDLDISGECYAASVQPILPFHTNNVNQYAFALVNTIVSACDGNSCARCGAYAHGESWCSYDSVLFSQSGSGGLAYVGSRSYRHSCIDGVEYIEEARDYREEICVQAQVGTLSLAKLRQNRWQTCSSCTTADCCQSETHDCSWSGWLDTENKCHPLVPPGFRFWEGNGMNVCAMATTNKRCEGFSCPHKWVDDTSLYCSYQGDCGNYRNVADVITKGGFFNSDPTDVPREYIYNPNGFNTNPVKNKVGAIVSVPLDVDVYNPNAVQFADPVNQLPLLTSAAFSYLDDISKISFSDFLNPFKKPQIEVLDFAFCSQWEAPLDVSNCDLCQKNGFCSEYRCKSLGQSCSFTEFEGVGYCMNQAPQSTQPVTITSFSSQSSKITQSTITAFGTTISGVKLEPQFFSGDVIAFNFTTSQPAKCKLSYAPNMSYIRLPSIWIGKGGFETNHEFMLRSPPAIIVPQHVYDALGIQSLSEVSSMAFQLEQVFESKVKQYDSQIKQYKQLTGIDIAEFARPYVKLASTVVTLFSKRFENTLAFLDFMLAEFETGTYYIFLKCQDEYGRESQPEQFVSFTISHADNQKPPVVLAAHFQNSSMQLGQSVPSSQSASNMSTLRIYLNEWSTCRYDYESKTYDAMSFVARCPVSQYDISPQEFGSYECTLSINRTLAAEYGGDVFVLCKDNPTKKKIIEFKTMTSAEYYAQDSYTAGVSPQYASTPSLLHNQSRFLEYTDNILRVTDGMLARNTLYIDTDVFGLHMYADDNLICQLDNSHNSFGCVASSADDVDLGFYVCKTTINRVSNMTILCSEEPKQQFVMAQPFVFTVP
jgi:hypothetical protein